MVHNGGSPNFQMLLFNKSTTDMAQILQSLSYKECFMILLKFTKCGLFILILVTYTNVNQTFCCYIVTTLEMGLYKLKVTISRTQKSKLHIATNSFTYITIFGQYYSLKKIQSYIKNWREAHRRAAYDSAVHETNLRDNGGKVQRFHK